MAPESVARLRAGCSEAHSTANLAADPNRCWRGVALQTAGITVLQAVADGHAVAVSASCSKPSQRVGRHREAAIASVRMALSFEWLLDPIEPTTFFTEFYERKPLLIERQQPLKFDRS